MPDDDDPRKTRFLWVLVYVFGFMLLLGILAFLAAALLRFFRS